MVGPVTEISLPTPFSDIIISVSWTGRTRSTNAWIKPTRLIKVSKSATCPQKCQPHGQLNCVTVSHLHYTTSYLDTVFILMYGLFFSPPFLITFMCCFSRNIAGYERCGIRVGMVDDWWRSECSNLFNSSLNIKVLPQEYPRGQKSVEKPDEVHVLDISGNSDYFWQIKESERLLGEIWLGFIKLSRFALHSDL